MAVHDHGRRALAVLLLCAGCEAGAPIGPGQPVGPDLVETGYRLTPNWPHSSVAPMLGEVSAIDLDSHGHLFVFHRATRGWDVVTQSRIQERTVLVIDTASGQLVASWGAGQFRLPHGLTVDAGDNIWLTDAALHQVFQYTHDGALRRTFGTTNSPGRDATHFNRPTDVFVRADGGFYVTDGYENQRVAQFRADGSYLREWGRLGAGPAEFALPHMIAARNNQLFVSDRENERISLFDTAGVAVRTIRPVPNVWVYAAAIDSIGRTFVALRNDGLGMGGVARINESGTIDRTIGAARDRSQSYLAVHDVVVDKVGTLFLAETRAGGLSKYTVTRERR